VVLAHREKRYEDTGAMFDREPRRIAPDFLFIGPNADSAPGPVSSGWFGVGHRPSDIAIGRGEARRGPRAVVEQPHAGARI